MEVLVTGLALVSRFMPGPVLKLHSLVLMSTLKDLCTGTGSTSHCGHMPHTAREKDHYVLLMFLSFFTF